MVNTLLLLETIQTYPFLYDKTRKDFKDAKKKQNAWQEIAYTLESDVHRVQTRWRTLRERFGRELKLVEKRTRNGQGQEDSMSKWHLFNNLSFLKAHFRPRGSTRDGLNTHLTHDSLKVNHTADNETNTRFSFDSSPPSSTASSRKSHIATTLTMNGGEKSKMASFKELDEDDIFCKSLAFELRKVTNSQEKQRRKAKMFLIATGIVPADI